MAGLSATDAEREGAPWHGMRKGKQGVRDFFAALLKSIEVTDFSPISLAKNWASSKPPVAAEPLHSGTELVAHF